MLVVIAIATAVEVANTLLLIWMLAFARHAWLTMPPSVPFPRLDRRGWSNEWDFKENVLTYWIVADALIWLVTSLLIIVPVISAKSGAMTLGDATMLPFALIFLAIPFALQRSALEKARALEDAVQGEAHEDAAQADGQAE